MRSYVRSLVGGREDADQVTQRYRENGSGESASRYRGGGRKEDEPREAGRRTKRANRGALDFSSLAAEGNHFINEVAREIGCPRNQAARITRAVLHALRDRLPPDDSIQFAQGLPLVMKGVWLDQYDISATPELARSAEEFLMMIEDRSPFTVDVDFPSPRHTAYALRAVFRVLEDTMDIGQTEQIRGLLGRSICNVIDKTGRF